MNTDHRNPRLRRGFAFVALAALLGLSAVSLTQCRMVNDTVTGVDLKANATASAKSNCVRQCNEKRKACQKAEDARHKEAKKACLSDKACKKAEDALHKDNKKACDQQKQLCKKGCYNEGAGSAGR
jgi:hypothetical protein